MIPFLEERLASIKQEALEKGHEATGEEKAFLNNSRKEVQQALDQETAKVNELAAKMYATWSRIHEIREGRGYQSSNVNLKVFQGEARPDGTHEYNFDQVPSNVDEKLKPNGEKLPSEETGRRACIKALTVKVGLKINGVHVAETNRYQVEWPECHAQVHE